LKQPSYIKNDLIARFLISSYSRCTSDTCRESSEKPSDPRLTTV